MRRSLALLLLAAPLALALAGCTGGGDNPKIETVSGDQAKQTIQHMRKPAAMGGAGAPAGAASTE
jgi:hypothetical protein